MPNLLIMCREEGGVVRYAPLYVHSFRLATPPKLLDAQLFQRQYREYGNIENVPDRLRWLRHRLGLTQKEVAERVGVSRSFYHHMENGACKISSFAVMDKLAALYQVPVTDLLDGRSRFLYDGQGRQIRALRESLGMSVPQFAESLGVYASTVRKWEKEQVKISKRSLERMRKLENALFDAQFSNLRFCKVSDLWDGNC